MKRTLILILFSLPFFLFSNEELTEVPELSSTEGLPSNIVNGTVCVISGEYTETAIDVVIQGPEPLVFARNYANKSHMLWTYNHMDKLHVQDIVEDKKPFLVTRLYLPNGSLIDYSHSNDSKSRKLETMFCRLKSNKGLTNGASCLSGRSNLKNQVVHYNPDKDHQKVINGAGDESTFEAVRKGSPYFRQRKLKKINGSNYRYNMNTNGLKGLSEIVCGNRKETTAFSSLLFYKFPKELKDKGLILRTSDGREIKYYAFVDTVNRAEKNTPAEWYDVPHLWKVESSFAPTIQYFYEEKSESVDLQIKEKRLPEDRCLITEYYKKGSNHVGGPGGWVNIKHHDDYRLNRVKLQKAPVGHDKKPVTTHRFVYDCKTKKHHSREETFEGTTEVYDAHDHKTTYEYDKHHRLETITHYTGKSTYKPCTQECFKWDKGSKEGNLLGKVIKDEEGNVHHARYFHYDEKGNVLKSELCGKLTGLPAPNLIVKETLSPANTGYEKEVKSYTYSEDYRNLPITETTSNGKTTVYHYVKDTDRIQAKWVLYDGQIQLREFYTYDDNYVMIKKVTDNGKATEQDDMTGVTERHFTYVTPRKAIPFGLPENIVEKCLDLKTGKKITLHSQVFHYSQQGQLLHQEFHDAAGDLVYVLHWEYDAHGNIIKEVNALGETISKRYDENGNLLFQQGPSLDYSIENEYDYVNRLICQKEIHSDGKIFATHYKYDRLSNCTSIIDPYGRETKQSYDEFGRMTKIQSPPVLNEAGELTTPVMTKKYNSAGHPICVTDPKNRSILTDFNIRGQPLHITYPDSSTEKFFYRLDGQLVHKIERTGIQLHYQRDPLGRVTEEKVLSSDGTLLKKKQHIYNALHLLKTIDETGLVTTYHYDAAGRVSILTVGDKVQQFLYDKMGRLYETREWFGENLMDYRATIKGFDLLNRVIEERLEDSAGTIFHLNRYTYDVRGNKVCVQNGDQITLTEYNVHNNPISITNALGEMTKTTYKHDFIDATGQRVLQTITTDPLGYQTIDTYDAAERLVQVERKTPFGLLVAKQSTFYDLCGNISRVQNHVMEEGEHKRTIESQLFYSENNQLITTIEACNTPEQKITRIQYNSAGQKISETKNNGLSLYYQYDPLGRLQTFTSSDGSIYYHYEYDLRDQPIRIIDMLTAQVTERLYDKYGELLSEKLGNGLTTAYAYDKMGRPRFVALPDQIGYEYVYNAVDLKEVHRLNNGQRIYTHYNNAHSPTGKVTHTTFAGGIQGHYTYDLLSRCTSILTPHFNQEIPSGGFDSAGNLRHFKAQEVPYHFDYDHLYQIKQEQGHEEHTYQFDSLNNRTKKDDEHYTHNALHQLIQKGNTSFTYDGNGNLIGRHDDTPTNYKYDALDRLISVTKNNVETFYTYDPLNRRLSKKQGSTEQLFLYHGQEEIGLYENGAIKEFRLLGNNKRNPMIALELKGVLYIPIHDMAGNVVCLQDSQGNVIERYRYTAFGESQVLSPAGEQLARSTVDNPWQYSSKRLDEESQFVAFGLRYYAPDIGRWITPDPIGTEDGPNMYAYVRNSPLNYYDQFGLCVMMPMLGQNMNRYNSSFEYTPQPQQQQSNGLGGSLFRGMLGMVFGGFTPTFNLPLEKTMSHWCRGTGDEMSLFATRDELDGCSGGMYSHLPEIYELNQLSIHNPATNSPYQFRQSENLHLGFTNGINNLYTEDFQESLLYLGRLTNHNAVGVYSPTYGVENDLYRCAFGRIGATSETVEKIHECWYNALSKNPQAKMFWVCHSRGAIDTRNALLTFPEALRERITVIAVAPGAFIEKNLCGNVVHLMSRDPIPFSDPVGMMRCCNTIEFVKPSRGAPWVDHSFMSKTYMNVIQFHWNRFNRENK